MILKWGQCTFESHSKGGLSVHISKKHKVIQVDGNDTITNDEEDREHLIRVTFIGESLEKSKEEFIKYYICDLTPANIEPLQFIESESGNIYKGSDHCYNKGDHFEYVFEFHVDKKHTKQKIEEIIFLDAVKSLKFI